MHPMHNKTIYVQIAHESCLRAFVCMMINRVVKSLKGCNNCLSDIRAQNNQNFLNLFFN